MWPGRGRLRDLGQLDAQLSQPLRFTRIAEHQPVGLVEQALEAVGVEQARFAKELGLLFSGFEGEESV